jgi:hypothetical protein
LLLRTDFARFCVFVAISSKCNLARIIDARQV